MTLDAKLKIKSFIHTHLSEMIDLRRVTDQELQKEQLQSRIRKHIQTALYKVQHHYPSISCDELIHEIIAAMAKRMSVHELAVMPHYHPTLAEIWTYPAEDLAKQIPV